MPDYLAPTRPTDLIQANATGVFRVGEHKPASPINTTTGAAGTEVITGLDFTQASGMLLELLFADQNTGIAWPVIPIDVDRMLLNHESDSALDAYAHIFDNDWVRVNVVDPQTGALNFVDMDRDMQYIGAELYARAPTVRGLIEVENPPASFSTTLFQFLKDITQFVNPCSKLL